MEYLFAPLLPLLPPYPPPPARLCVCSPPVTGGLPKQEQDEYVPRLISEFPLPSPGKVHICRIIFLTGAVCVGGGGGGLCVSWCGGRERVRGGVSMYVWLCSCRCVSLCVGSLS